MSKGRLEAFSDGVLAIIITIMVLELAVPHEPTLDALLGLWPVFISYVLSFANVGIYWNNHHHLLQASRVVDGRVLWANLHLLFWLSLFPFATAWMGENDFAAVPVAVYGVVAVMAAIAYFVLVRALVRCQPADTHLAEAIGNDVKGKISPLIYALAVPVALLPVPLAPFVAFALYVVVALIWVVPDVRIERTIAR
ncbi:MAG TPA: TMEM175 family protein [Candidatus Limnocylindrales bacterium]|nr:TMEM175 family protein [Candidatus Limnocylindrales bacterium]